ncbi:MAG: bifunctional 4-hydroxy-2-oxoglutarate aldolase/2-dehydro-3-deoxy-phosphogluconate aldolase [Defluviitaleaceae bacterium]|nr:bifunctional 4-hydroxy-2-oxoglutarate aldolase/2-dehydro-3-deoxy-phosphogluconate aldolase [Defluviitaleaceae bacterium]
MQNIFDKLRNIGIVPVVKLDDPKDAVPLAKALAAGGIPCAEVTFRTDAAEESIRAITSELPDVLVGAGTVTNPDQLNRAINAGAAFIVTPGFNPVVVQACIDRGMPICPGAITPSEIEQALELGLKTVKFFPAGPMGGLDTIKALAGPYGDLQFMPTGGINTKNIVEHLNFPKIVACGGSWMVDPKMIAAGDFEGITRISRESVQAVLGFELAHVGINCADGGEAERVAKMFCTFFNMEYKPGNSTVFAGTAIECGAGLPFGKNHIAIATNFIERAVFQLKSKGVTFDEAGAKYDAGGKLVAIYLQDDFGGMAVHLLQKK